uniref:PepSY domain-containing protein n=1 Tax=Roseihalotalea indica TaxID=2867963 RepID=A0AA49GRG0_9BACT|nr:hypothetical protein K4G66_10525 [Tunicatimonas sp. TK19036]
MIVSSGYKQLLIIFLVGGLSLYFEPSYAQNNVKEEVEKRIKAEEMPKAAMSILSDWLKDSRRVRFYYETDGDHQTYETKLIRNERHFSIEFDNSGVLMDIEELINTEQLPDAVIETIHNVLSRTYEKHKIRRIQRQFLPKNSDENLLNTILSFSEETEQFINYEIEVNVKEQSRMRAYEILFDAEGQILDQRLIVRRSLDNLLY